MRCSQRHDRWDAQAPGTAPRVGKEDRINLGLRSATRRRLAQPAFGAAALLLMLAGCVDPSAPASQRTLFDGMRDIMSGRAEANASGLERSADTAEQTAQRGNARLASANAAVQQSNEEVAAARARLSRVQQQLDQQRARLSVLETSRGSRAAQEEAARLRRETSALEAERRRLQDTPGGASGTDVRRLETQTQDLRRALDRLQTL